MRPNLATGRGSQTSLIDSFSGICPHGTDGFTLPARTLTCSHKPAVNVLRSPSSKGHIACPHRSRRLDSLARWQAVCSKEERDADSAVGSPGASLERRALKAGAAGSERDRPPTQHSEPQEHRKVRRRGECRDFRSVRFLYGNASRSSRKAVPRRASHNSLRARTEVSGASQAETHSIVRAPRPPAEPRSDRATRRPEQSTCTRHAAPSETRRVPDA